MTSLNSVNLCQSSHSRRIKASLPLLPTPPNPSALSLLTRRTQVSTKTESMEITSCLANNLLAVDIEPNRNDPRIESSRVSSEVSCGVSIRIPGQVRSGRVESKEVESTRFESNRRIELKQVQTGNSKATRVESCRVDPSRVESSRSERRDEATQSAPRLL